MFADGKTSRPEQIMVTMTARPGGMMEINPGFMDRCRALWRSLPAAALVGYVEAAIALSFDIKIEDLRGSGRQQAKIVFARQVVMYLTHICFGLPICVIAKAMERNWKTVFRALAAVEDARDDLDTDFMLDYLEAAMVMRLLAVNGVAQLKNASALGDYL